MDIASLIIEADSRQITSAIAELERLEGMAGNVEAGGQRIAGSFDFVNNALKSLTAGLTVFAAINVWREFDKATRDTANLTGAALGEIKQMAMDSANELGKSATSVAQAFGVVGSATPALLKMPEALRQVTDSALVLASAANATGDAMSDIEGAQAITGALNQWGVAQDELAAKSVEFANVMAAGAEAGSASVTEITQSMAIAGAVAAGANIPLLDFASALEVLAEKQMKGALAGTAMRNMITILQTSDAAFEAYGISGMSATLATDGLAAALEKAKPILNDANAMVDVFKSENLAAAKILVGGTEALRGYQAAMSGTTTAFDQAAAGAATFDTQLSKLLNNLSNIASQGIDAVFGPSMTSGITTASSSLTNLNMVLQQFVADTGTFKTVMDALALSLSVLAVRAMAPLAVSIAQGISQWAVYQSTLLMVSASSARVTVQQEQESIRLVRARALHTKALYEEAAAFMRDIEVMGIYGAQRSAAIAQLTAATARHTVSTTALTAAEGRLASAMAATTLAARVQSAAVSAAGSTMMLLGGPLGIAMIVGGALLYLAMTFETSADKASKLRGEIDALAGSFREMGKAELAANMVKVKTNDSNLANDEVAAWEKAANAKEMVQKSETWAGESNRSQNDIERIELWKQRSVDAEAEVEIARKRRVGSLQLIKDMESQAITLAEKSTKTTKDQAVASAALSENQKKNKAEVDAYMDSLGKEIVMLGKSEKEKKLYELANKGASEEQRRAAGIMLDQIKAQDELEKSAKKGHGAVQKEAKKSAAELEKAAEAADRLWSNLAKETATLGMGEIAEQAWDLANALKSAGLNQAQINKQVEEFTAQKELNKDFAETDKLMEENVKNYDARQVSQLQTIQAMEEEFALTSRLNEKDKERAMFLRDFEGKNKDRAAAIYDQVKAQEELNRVTKEMRVLIEDLTVKAIDFLSSLIGGTAEWKGMLKDGASMLGKASIALANKKPGEKTGFNFAGMDVADITGKNIFLGVKDVFGAGAAEAIAPLTAGFDSIVEAAGGLSNVMGYAGAAMNLFSKGINTDSILSSAGMAIGTYFGGPIGAQIGSMIGSALAKLEGGETRSGAVYKVDAKGKAEKFQGPSGGEIASSEVKSALSTTVSLTNSLLEKLGSHSRVGEFTGALETSENNKGGVYSGGKLSTGEAYGEQFDGQNVFESQTSRNLNPEQALEAFSLDLQQSVLQALQAAADTPEWIKPILDGVDIELLTIAQVEGLLTSITAMSSISDYFKSLGADIDLLELQKNMTPEQIVAGLSALTVVNPVMQGLGKSALGFTQSGLLAADAIVKVSGGLERFAANAKTYFEEFYTDQERSQMLSTVLTEQLTREFGKYNMAVPESKEAFRALVDSLDLTTESGQRAYAELMRVAPVYAELAEIQKEQADAFKAKIEEIFAVTPQSMGDEMTSIVFDAKNAEEAGAQMSQMFARTFYEGMIGSVMNSVAQTMMGAVVQPLLNSAGTVAMNLGTGGAMAGANLGAGSAVAGANLGTGGAMAGTQMGTGGAMAGSAMGTGGATAGSNLVAGANIAAGALASAVASARSQISTMLAVLKDEGVQDLLGDVQDAFGEIGETAYQTFEPYTSQFQAIDTSASKASDSVGGLTDSIDDLTQKLIDSSKDLKQWLDDQKLDENSTLTPEQKLAEAEKQTNDMMLAVQKGDANSSELTSLLDKTLELRREVYKTQGFDLYERAIRSSVENLIGSLDSQASDSALAPIVPQDQIALRSIAPTKSGTEGEAESRADTKLLKEILAELRQGNEISETGFSNTARRLQSTPARA